MNFLNLDVQRIKLAPQLIDKRDVILDIGGGGEAIISRAFTQNSVISMDNRRSELEESGSDGIKIVMDATDMKFLAETINVATSFFTFMYLPAEKKMSALKEIFRVLKQSGELLIWNSNIMIAEENLKYDAVIVNLEIELPNKQMISTGYGIPYQYDFEISDTQLIRMAREIGFVISVHLTDDSSLFFLKMQKK